MTRPTFDEYFLAIAKTVSTRADCSRSQHGAVIVKNNRILSAGYNGPPAGDPRSCTGGDCPRAHSGLEHLNPDYSNCIACHAEQNAIAYARDTGDTIFITGRPCDACSKLIAAALIKRVVWPDGNFAV